MIWSFLLIVGVLIGGLIGRYAFRPDPITVTEKEIVWKEKVVEYPAKIDTVYKTIEKIKMGWKIRDIYDTVKVVIRDTVYLKEPKTLISTFHYNPEEFNLLLEGFSRAPIDSAIFVHRMNEAYINRIINQNQIPYPTYMKCFLIGTGLALATIFYVGAGGL